MPRQSIVQQCVRQFHLTRDNTDKQDSDIGYVNKLAVTAFLMSGSFLMLGIMTNSTHTTVRTAYAQAGKDESCRHQRRVSKVAESHGERMVKRHND